MTPHRIVRSILPCLVMFSAMSQVLIGQQRELGGRLGGSAPQQAARMSVIKGVVVQDDGAPLPSGVVIERNCHGQVTRESLVDSSGGFIFQVGSGNRFARLGPDVRDDVSEERGSPDTMTLEESPSLAGCEIRARADGYHSTGVVLSVNPAGHVDVGTLVLFPASRLQGTLVSATDLAAPKSARKQLDRSQKAVRAGEFDKAEHLLRGAVNIYPPYASAWFNFAQLYESVY